MKRIRPAVGLIVLCAALLVGWMLYTQKASDPLEGVWYGEAFEQTGYPEYKEAVSTRFVFRDGQARMMQYRNGIFDWGRDYTYTAKDGVLYLNLTDYANSIEQYPYELQGDTMTIYSKSGRVEGTLTRGELPRWELLPDPLTVVEYYEDLAYDPVWEAFPLSLNYYEHHLLDLLQVAEIAERRDNTLLTDFSDYCYRLTLSDRQGQYQLLIADGWVYRDTTAYRLSGDGAFLKLMKEIPWQPVGGLQDEYGLTYYPYSQGTGWSVELHMQNQYREYRQYVLQDQEAWTEAIEDARKHSIPGDPTHLQSSDIIGYLEGDTSPSWIYIYSDGTVSYRNYETDTDHHVKKEDAPALASLMEPYLKVYWDSVEDSEGMQPLGGVWFCTEQTADGNGQYIKLYLDYNAKYAAASAKSGWFAAQVGDHVVEGEFDFYIQDGRFHVRWMDGTEEAVPCVVQDDTLTLTFGGEQWVFEKSTSNNPITGRWDLIRFPQAYHGLRNIHADLTDEQLGELEELLRSGMQERESKFIAVDAVYYRLSGLENAFGTSNITLSDRGTLHIDGEPYTLTNWAQIEAFLDELIRTR